MITAWPYNLNGEYTQRSKLLVPVVVVLLSSNIEDNKLSVNGRALSFLLVASLFVDGKEKMTRVSEYRRSDPDLLLRISCQSL